MFTGPGGNRGAGSGDGINNNNGGPDAYTDEDIANLLYMLEEEKLAGDIYEALYDQTGLQIFANIAESEDSHVAALLAQADVMDIDVSAILAEPAGSFVNPDLQALYDTLLAQGSESATAALEVGVLIEETDIVDLQEAASSVEGTALAAVYDNLLDGSANHLDAFEAWLGA
ncbi:DUF2202 domain-containing protein [Rhodovulum sp. P5]|uniref:DUF2202 domain-containing protein n=1 Tax=Rhodovulum sp. P5 TaxID=1564506 RepID=UPI001C12B152|nr:DUF2202 domain-containing protein [Rhodovulum sp. P5]